MNYLSRSLCRYWGALTVLILFDFLASMIIVRIQIKLIFSELRKVRLCIFQYLASLNGNYKFFFQF